MYVENPVMIYMYFKASYKLAVVACSRLGYLQRSAFLINGGDRERIQELISFFDASILPPNCSPFIILFSGR
jgi:hypothetical protein